MIRFEFANGLTLSYDDSYAPVLSGINFNENTLNPSNMAFKAVRQASNEVKSSKKPYVEKLRNDTDYIRRLNEVKSTVRCDEVTMDFTVTAELTTKSIKSVNKYDGKEHEFIMYYINDRLVAVKRDDGRHFTGIRLAIDYDEQVLIDHLNVDSEMNRRCTKFEKRISDIVTEFGFQNFYAEISYQDTAEFNNHLVETTIGEKFIDEI